jgi:hypothetical protein
MIEHGKNTTLILGAGASVEYGLPTGEKLIEDIINLSKGPFRKSNWLRDGLGLGKNTFWKEEINDINQFHREIVDFAPVSIDRFLTLNQSNPKIVQIGKKLITHVVARSQSSYQNGWYKYLLDQLVKDSSPEAILERLKSLNVITFNYDLTLEEFLHNSIQSLARTTGYEYTAVIDCILSRIIHVYGAIFDFSDNRDLSRFRGWDAEVPDSYFVKSIYNNDIRVIGEERSKDQLHLKRIQERVWDADRIYILGFGFDEVNVSIAGLDRLNNSKPLEINITNFEGSKKLQRKIDKLFSKEKLPKAEIHVSTNSTFDAIRCEFE